MRQNTVLCAVWGLGVYYTAVDCINSRNEHISSGGALSYNEKRQEQIINGNEISQVATQKLFTRAAAVQKCKRATLSGSGTYSAVDHAWHLLTLLQNQELSPLQWSSLALLSLCVQNCLPKKLNLQLIFATKRGQWYLVRNTPYLFF